MTRHLRFVVLVAALALPISAVQAQTVAPRTQFGIQLSFADDAELGVGGRVRYGLQGLFPRAPLSSQASLDFFFPGNDVTYAEINYNVVYNFRVGSAPRVGPYAGGGLNFAYVKQDFGGAIGSRSDTDLGLNILGGINFRGGSRLTPFLELRAELGGGEQLVFTGGIYF